MTLWGCQESYTTDSFRATQSNFNQIPFVKFDRVPIAAFRRSAIDFGIADIRHEP